VIVMAVTSVLATIEQRLVLRKLGALQGDDVQAFRYRHFGK
jgi:hypothetical protein